MRSTRVIHASVIGLVVCAWAGGLCGQQSTQPTAGGPPQTFSSVAELQRYYSQRIDESRQALEAERLTALERLHKTAKGDERQAALEAMIGSALSIRRYEQVVLLTDTFLKEYPSDPSLWTVRRVRFGALVEANQLTQARQEWEKLSGQVDMKAWQEMFESGMLVGEGFLDVGKVEEAKAVFEPLKKKFSFVDNAGTIVNTRLDGLYWVGRPAPALQGKDLSGQKVDLSAQRGKVVLIDFWATWCQPCIIALPELIRTYEGLHESGFEIIGISLDNDPQALKEFLQRRPLAWPVVSDGRGWDNPNARSYDVTSIPAAFLVDRQGKIARVGTPSRGFSPVVRRLLAEPAPAKP